MEIVINEADVEIWVANGIPEADVQAYVTRYIAEGYYPIVYRTGVDDIIDLTGLLILNNM